MAEYDILGERTLVEKISSFFSSNLFDLKSVNRVARHLTKFKTVKGFKDNKSDALLYLLFSLNDREFKDPSLEQFRQLFRGTQYIAPEIYGYDILRFDADEYVRLDYMALSDITMVSDIVHYHNILNRLKKNIRSLMVAKQVRNENIELYEKKVLNVMVDLENSRSELEEKFPKVQLDGVISSLKSSKSHHAVVTYRSDYELDALVAELNNRKQSFILFE